MAEKQTHKYRVNDTNLVAHYAMNMQKYICTPQYNADVNKYIYMEAEYLQPVLK